MFTLQLFKTISCIYSENNGEGNVKKSFLAIAGLLVRFLTLPSDWLEIVIDGFLKKKFGCWWVVVNDGGYILAGGGWWGIYFGWWWMVVDSGGWWHSLVWPKKLRLHVITWNRKTIIELSCTNIYTIEKKFFSFATFEGLWVVSFQKVKIMDCTLVCVSPLRFFREEKTKQILFEVN